MKERREIMLKEEVLKNLPKVNQGLVHQLLTKEVKKSGRKIIVLDDDPTGIQTVNGVSVYTDWSKESIYSGFKEKENLFFILTNSRSFTKEKTKNVHKEIAENIETVAMGRPYLLISRSDSTLRGHYPLETETLKGEIEKNHTWKFDGEIICPFFSEGGRFTIGNQHYVKEGTDLIPAEETEFAKDQTFGYHSSYLPDYIEEKSNHCYVASEVICISLNDLRSMRLEKIEKQLMQVKKFQKIVVNAVENVDVEIFCVALYRALDKGKHFLFRTAAAFVKAISNGTTKPYLRKKDLIFQENSNGGLIMIGSHTEKTTKQMNYLEKIPHLHFEELNTDFILNKEKMEKEVQRVLDEVQNYIGNGITTVVSTKRKVMSLKNDSKESALMRSVQISEFVQEIVRKLERKPSFIVAKGGITSSDIGVKALEVKRAIVLGQIQPGVPVWKTDSGSKFPDIPYVIFPGNVGTEESLYETVKILLEDN